MELKPGPEHPRVLHACMQALAAALEAPHSSISLWLSAVAAILRSALHPSSVPLSTGAVVRLGLLSGSGQSPTVLAVGAAGGVKSGGLPAAATSSSHTIATGRIPAPQDVEAALLLVAREEWFAQADQRQGPRRYLLPDPTWGMHPLRRARALLGLDEFIVYAAPLPAPPARHTFTLQLDRPLDAAWSETELDAIAAALCPYLARFFDFILWRPMQRQRLLLEKISAIQREILPLLIEGKTERDIAEVMHRSPHTIHDHVKNIYGNLGVNSRVQLLEAWLGLELPHAKDSES